MTGRLRSYGPSIVVLVTVAVVLLAGPYAIRALTYAQTQRNIELATNRLQQGSNILEVIDQANRDIAMKIQPSVVYISTERLMPAGGFRGPAVRVSSGSGWVYDDFGHIVTNAHVIEEAERIEVQLHTGELREAEIIGTDLRTDIAVIKVDAGGLHPAERASSASVMQGDQVFAFGSPFDFRFSMSQGIVSGVGRHAQLETIRYQNFIQTDAAINPGNSGGPLTDIYGRVVGMNTAIATGAEPQMDGGTFSGIGLAIPMDMIESVVDQFIETGEVARGFIGVELHETLAAGAARAQGFKGEGVEVKFVQPGSPAEEAGLRPGDVILAVGSRPVAALKQIQSIISSHAPGETLQVSIWRYDESNGQNIETTLPVTLTELKPEQMVDRRILGLLTQLGFGELETATPQRATSLGVPFTRGVLIESVIKGSPVDGTVPVGSVITGIFDDPVHSLDEFYARLERALIASPRGITMRVVLPSGEATTIPLRLF